MSCAQHLADVVDSLGNVITLIVLNRRLMRKGGINNLLQGLAISDIVAPTIACIPPIIYYYGQKDSAKLVSFINSFIMPLATGATFCSNWIGEMIVLNAAPANRWISSCDHHLFPSDDRCQTILLPSVLFESERTKSLGNHMRI